MRYDVRDVADAGRYLCAVGAVLTAITVAGAAVIKSASDAPLFG